MGTYFFGERWRWFLAGALFFVVLAVYAPSLSVGYLSDDWGYAYNAQTLSMSSALRFIWQPDLFGAGFINYRPLQSMLSVWLWKPLLHVPVVLHLLSLIGHAFTGLLVAELFFRIFGDRRGAWLAGFFFLVHPLQVETAVWLSSANSLLGVGFLLGACVLYAHVHATFRRSLLVAALLIASLLSKEFALLFPFCALGIDLLLRRKIRWRWIAAAYLLDVAYIIARIAVLHRLGGYAVDNVSIYRQFDGQALWQFFQLPGFMLFEFFIEGIGLTRLLRWAAGIAGVAFGLMLVSRIRAGSKHAARQIILLTVLLYISAALTWNMYYVVVAMFENIRWLHFSLVWFALIFAYCAVRTHFTRRLGVLIVIIYGCMAVGYQYPWLIADHFSKQYVKAVQQLPAQTVWRFDLLPDSFHGAFIFRNGMAMMIAMQQRKQFEQIDFSYNGFYRID